ncbi:MAG: Flp family type IVb pilin [Terracidiphilus sp.]
MQDIPLYLYVKLQSLTRSEDGQDLVEYALLISFIALVCIAAIAPVGSSLSKMYSNIGTSVGSLPDQ